MNRLLCVVCMSQYIFLATIGRSLMLKFRTYQIEKWLSRMVL